MVNESVDTLLKQIVLIIPILEWLFDLISNLNDDIKRLDNISMIINMNGNTTMKHLQIVQSKIYEHRSKCYSIPDFVYYILKENDEKREHRAMKL